MDKIAAHELQSGEYFYSHSVRVLYEGKEIGVTAQNKGGIVFILYIYNGCVVGVCLFHSAVGRVEPSPLHHCVSLFPFFFALVGLFRHCGSLHGRQSRLLQSML